uniref:Neurotransmitter-gated ion-channel ligand-binding domain-containing protein n=1 Tax=Globisporangium ultimum (strain ATCC 200006 / CBS 805.95 / DAOM BR144) TaxID=431595 RepID=K3WI57_GLOUD
MPSTTTASSSAGQTLELASAPFVSAPLDVAATVAQIQRWSAKLVKYHVRAEHAAVDISTDRIVYFLDCELDTPIPTAYVDHFEFICLGWPLGGIWKIIKTDASKRVLKCLSWRKTELNHEEVDAVNEEFAKRQQVAVPDPPLKIFDWKMQLGTWKNQNHWFLRDSGLPVPPLGGSMDKTPAGGAAMATEIPLDTLVDVKLMAGFAPLEVYLSVNSITSIDTVAQTYTADVTWEVTVSAVTVIREDSVLRELLDVLEFNEDEFEFRNITSMVEELDIKTVLAFAGFVEFRDPLAPDVPAKEMLSHLKYSRRTIAVFNEEMSLFNFPYDQQKLSFEFSMTGGVRASLPISPTPIDPGKFVLENYKLGNMFNVVYGSKVFVGDIHDTPDRKTIDFEMTLGRKSGYYFTNVAIPSAIITYLSFTTYAPLDDGTLMDTGSRLQIVMTLLLTTVTFKSQVASLIPQVSYYTSLDKYVFFCFVITCLVTVENSLYPVIVKLLPSGDVWQEQGLLGFSIGAFSFINLAWASYLIFWIRLRAHRSKILLKVEEYARVVSAAVPVSHREAVLREHMDEMNLKEWEIPQITCTKFGFLYLELPEDSLSADKNKNIAEPMSLAFREEAHGDLAAIQRLYHKLDPSAPSSDASVDLHDHGEIAANGMVSRMSSSCVVVNMQDESDAAPLRHSLGSAARRRQSRASEHAHYNATLDGMTKQQSI